jgi:hypothetical protein
MSNDRGYENLSYGQADLAKVMRETYDQLIDFVTTLEFQSVMREIGELEPNQRPLFVHEVLLDDEQLDQRGIHPPDGVLILRSAFGDRRPTLFCVKKFLPPEFRDVWENVNLTFDNEFADEAVSRSPEVAWRWPLPVAHQAHVMASGGDLERI